MRDLLNNTQVRISLKCILMETFGSNMDNPPLLIPFCRNLQEMRHYEALKDKIRHMEEKHAQRERDLQQIIRNSHHGNQPEMAEETEKWKRIVEVKNREIEKFRAELDSILEVLRELHRQGVVLPYKNSNLVHRENNRA